MKIKINKLARVFPTKTRMTPRDPHAYYDVPGPFTPKYDEIHISVVFTWDIEKAHAWAEEWKEYGKVKIGGPAMGDPGGEFVPGKYLAHGVTITSRGCVNKCGFCFVPKREGGIREIQIKPGYIIQDNNLLACSKQHKDKVWAMLKKEQYNSRLGIEFPGGFEASRVDDDTVENLRSLRIHQIWLAYDHPGAEKPLIKAVGKLKKYFTNIDRIRCYVLVGYKGDTVEKAEWRLKRTWEIGALPFAMLYRADDGTKTTDPKWSKLRTDWCVPAIIKTREKNTPHMKHE